jgi:hypothetical protein
VEELLAADTFVRLRQAGKKGKAKEYDLRPLILALRIEDQRDGELLLVMRLRQTPYETGRPDEVLYSLGFDPLDTLVHRTRIYLNEELTVVAPAPGVTSTGAT